MIKQSELEVQVTVQVVQVTALTTGVNMLNVYVAMSVDFTLAKQLLADWQSI